MFFLKSELYIFNDQSFILRRNSGKYFNFIDRFCIEQILM